MKTHYDVLNVDKDCSAKEIKASYIRLSKKYHPDRNKDADAHKRFVEVNEAYSVLGKPNTRHIYDESLSCARQTVHHTVRNGPRTYEEYTFKYAENLKRQQESGRPYTNKPKFSVIVFCFVIMAVGSALQLKADMNRRYYRSQQISASYKEHKERLQSMSKEERINELKEKMLTKKLTSENPKKQ